MKRCSTCGRTLPRTAFYKCSATVSGLTSACKECAAAARARRRRTASKRNRILINSWKIRQGACATCAIPVAEPLSDFHCDHVDPATKSFTLATAQDRAAGTVVAELEKCQLLCKSCHQERTVNERHYSFRRDGQFTPGALIASDMHPTLFEEQST